MKQFEIFAIVCALCCASLQELSLQVHESSSFTVRQAPTLIIDLISHMKAHVNTYHEFDKCKSILQNLNKKDYMTQHCVLTLKYL